MSILNYCTRIDKIGSDKSTRYIVVINYTDFIKPLRRGEEGTTVYSKGYIDKSGEITGEPTYFKSEDRAESSIEKFKYLHNLR